MKLYGLTYEQLWNYDAISYDLSLLNYDGMAQATTVLQCSKPSAQNCRVSMSQA
jgi:hypothetical protein